jgi:hypothetical protein
MSWIDTVLSDFASCPSRWVYGGVPASQQENPRYRTIMEHWQQRAAWPCCAHRTYKMNRLPAGFRQYDEASVTTAVKELKERS